MLMLKFEFLGTCEWMKIKKVGAWSVDRNDDVENVSLIKTSENTDFFCTQVKM